MQRSLAINPDPFRSAAPIAQEMDLNVTYNHNQGSKWQLDTPLYVIDGSSFVSCSWDPLSLVPRPLLCFVLRFAFGIIIDSLYLPKVYTIYGIIHVRFRGDAKPSYDSEFEVYG